MFRSILTGTRGTGVLALFIMLTTVGVLAGFASLMKTVFPGPVLRKFTFLFQFSTTGTSFHCFFSLCVQKLYENTTPFGRVSQSGIRNSGKKSQKTLSAQRGAVRWIHLDKITRFSIRNHNIMAKPGNPVKRAKASKSKGSVRFPTTTDNRTP